MDSMDTPRSNELARRVIPTTPVRLLPTRVGGGNGASADRPTLSPQVVLRGLKRYWWQALFIWLVGSTSLGILIYLKVKPDYEASSILRVELASQDLFTDKTLDTRDRELETQVQLVTSTNVLSAVAARPEIAAQPTIRKAVDAEAALRKILQVQIIPKTQLIRISASLPSPTEAAEIVNAVVEVFLETDAEWAANMTRQQIGNLKSYRQKLETTVTKLERELLELAAKGNLDPVLLGDASKSRSEASELARSSSSKTSELPATLHNVTIEEYKFARARLLEIDMELTAAEALLPSKEANSALAISQEFSEDQILEALRTDPEIRTVYGDLMAAKDRMDQVSKRVRKASDPASQQVRQQLEALEAEYRQLWAAKDILYRQRLAELGSVMPNQQAAGGVPIERQVAELRANKARLETWLSQVDVTNRQQSTDTVQATFLNADWQQHRQMLQSVNSRLEQLEFEAQGMRRIFQIDQARPPGDPLADKQRKYLALAPIGMLGMVLALTTLLELRGQRVAGADEMTSRMALEVFTVPPLPTLRSASARKAGGSDPIELFVQQLDHLRVALCGEVGQDGPGRCVLITSAVGGEGKTTLAAQLAVRCAEAGATTLLIDADLRRASLGKLFEVPECPGLSDVLRGEVVNVEDALVPVSQVGGCQLLPAGSLEESPSRILQGHRIGPLLERLRQQFDVILIDTPPVLPVPDSLILGRQADWAVLATRHDQSRFPMVERAHRMLVGAGVPVLGVVINGVEPADSRYGVYAYSYGANRDVASSTEV